MGNRYNNTSRAVSVFVWSSDLDQPPDHNKLLHKCRTIDARHHTTPRPSHNSFPLSLFRPKPGRSNVSPPQLDSQHSLQITQDLLIRLRRPVLITLHHRLRRITLGRQILLCHLRLHLVPPFHNRLCNLLSDRLGLDDVVFTVNFGQMLPFRLWSLHSTSQSADRWVSHV